MNLPAFLAGFLANIDTFTFAELVECVTDDANCHGETAPSEAAIAAALSAECIAGNVRWRIANFARTYTPAR